MRKNISHSFDPMCNSALNSAIYNHYLLGVQVYAKLQKRSARWDPIDCSTVQDLCLRGLSRDFRDLSTFRLCIPKEIRGRRFYQKLLRVYRSRIGFNRVYEKGYRINKNDSHAIVLAAASDYFTAIGTPLSLKLRTLVERGDNESLSELVSTTVDPNSATYADNSDLFFRDYSAVSFLRKYEGFDIGIDTVKEAALAWIHAEKQCANFNTRVLTDDFTIQDKRFFYQVRKVIQRILGACPSLADISKNVRMGSGSTTSTPSKFCSTFDKLESNMMVSPQCYSLARGVFQYPENKFHLNVDEFVVSASSKWSTVKKTAKTDRPIEIPLLVDSMIQLSLGELIRQKLKRFGLNLNTQAEVNGLLAKYGSLYGTLATLDLQSASDTISYQLVKLLLPKGWFNLLNACRSRMVELPDGTHYHLQKFSAMGNGYTFEVESLIFLAVTLVSCGYLMPRRLPSVIGVYGDDICCPTIDAIQVTSNLELCGFKLNASKSYCHGPFRESCGQDFFRGAPVRPYFQKKEIKDVTGLFTLVNGIRSVSVRSLCYYGSDVRYRDVWRKLVQIIPEKYRIFGHSSLGDTVIWGSPADGVTGYTPVYQRSAWHYLKRWCYKAEHRTINYSAYDGTTLIHTWVLQKMSAISEPFEKRVRRKDSSIQEALGRVFSPCIVLPQYFRDSINYKPKWYYQEGRDKCQAQVMTANGCDCPPFI